MPLDSSLGALEIGTLLSGILFGLLGGQIYTYHKTCWKGDVIWLRGLVVIVCLLEMAVTALSFFTLYDMTVTNFGNLNALAGAPNSLIITQLLQHLIMTLVQGFFIYRIYKLPNTLFVTILASVLLLLRLVAAIAVQVLASVSLGKGESSIVDYVHKYFWITVAKDMIGVASDTLIAAVLLMRLFRERSDALNQTLPVVDKLILYTVETGFTTGCFSILISVVLLAMKHNYIWIGIWLLSSKIFSNTLLANLNSRASLRNQMMHSSGLETLSRFQVDINHNGYTETVPLGTCITTNEVQMNADRIQRESTVEEATSESTLHETLKTSMESIPPRSIPSPFSKVTDQFEVPVVR
ncbi:hypothetical protein K435DRAFT_787462 [Dendrothele bispora CBS 962.96]|uniref:DUF6534 domain-containing protein n=1 Tax=Dendrothele bispora (strain CBS 962.96) TaxID=1314807 RepID=A0A4S8KK77_DENBC|nr:hypothetical protein K435DRAFT_787462 [Dendrothele bispora CBS 962.96]